MDHLRRPRLHLRSAFPEGHSAFQALDATVNGSGLERRLLELVRLRASQINGCAYCVDMHSQEARALGEREQRIVTLSVWRDTPFFDARERAALALTERVTLVSGAGVHDADIAAAREHFNESEVVKLLYVIAVINAWNRLSMAAGALAGTYHPAAQAGTDS